MGQIDETDINSLYRDIFNRVISDLVLRKKRPRIIQPDIMSKVTRQDCANAARGLLIEKIITNEEYERILDALNERELEERRRKDEV